MIEPETKKPRKSLTRDDSASEISAYTPHKRKTRKSKRYRGGTHVITKPQWIPQDDYLLINSIVQSCDLLEVYEQVKFSKHYSYRSIETRWKDLLSSETKSSVALEAISKLSELEKLSLDRQVPLNESERNILVTVLFKEVFPSDKSSPSMEPFVNLLEKRKKEFFRFREPEDLFKCWSCMRKYGLIYPDPTSAISNQLTDLEEFEYGIVTGKEKVSTESFNRFLKYKSIINGQESYQNVSDKNLPNQDIIVSLLVEKMKQRRRLIRRLRLAGEEAHRWTAAVDHIFNVSILGVLPHDVFAVVVGLVTRFLLRSHHTSFGRSSPTIKPDIDLSCEAHCQRISRIQGYIRLGCDGVFFIGNLGRVSIWVNESPLLNGEETVLGDDSVILIERLSLRFNKNPSCSEFFDSRPAFPNSSSNINIKSMIPLFFDSTDPSKTLTTQSEIRQAFASKHSTESLPSPRAVTPNANATTPNNSTIPYQNTSPNGRNSVGANVNSRSANSSPALPSKSEPNLNSGIRPNFKNPLLQVGITEPPPPSVTISRNNSNKASATVNSNNRYRPCVGQQTTVHKNPHIFANHFNAIKSGQQVYSHMQHQHNQSLAGGMIRLKSAAAPNTTQILLQQKFSTNNPSIQSFVNSPAVIFSSHLIRTPQTSTTTVVTSNESRRKQKLN